jgi:hypothetical protein
MVRMTVGLPLQRSVFVIRGLDPRIHAEVPHVSFAKRPSASSTNRMDCRIKSGNDVV